VRPAAALEHYRRALALRPDHRDALNNLGVLWKEFERPELAVAAYSRAVEVDPDFGLAWFNLGNSHREENRLPAALECYRRALALAPNDRETIVNLAITLREMRQLDESMDLLDALVEQSPEFPEARFNRSTIHLLRGELARGWDDYESRLQIGPDVRPLSGTRWDGGSLDGRSIRVLSEQGIGDQVMFASCLPDVASSRSERCFVECDSRLVALFARSFPQLTMIAKTADTLREPSRGPFDIIEPIGSLPKHRRRRIEDFPRNTGYLKPDPDLVATWRSRLARVGGALKVGISWSGGKDFETRRRRSIPLELWGAVFRVPGVRFFNLQHGPSAAEAADAASRFGITLDDGADCNPLVNLDDFAAKIAGLDLVLSVDNSTAHLAAALGRPVWTLLPHACDWRWMLDGETTPWYPTMRLLRCRTPDGWTELLQRAARLLTSATFSLAF
jgi:hypothetical protein